MKARSVEQPKKDPQKELELSLCELEERVDRLRTLYEQYFMGIEKIEPGVQRREIDRRFLLLRKTQIRNTAQRYRFNVITQKYNTYSMYWTRICRQIEEGTFKRHIAKAARRFGDSTQKRERDDSIEVDFGDFADLDDADMEAVLADANAQFDSPSQRAVASDDRPSRTADPPAAAKVQLGNKDANANLDAPAVDGVSVDANPLANGAPRAARPVALPPGAKPILVRRRSPSDTGPGSNRSLDPSPNSSPAASSGVRPPMGSSPDRSAPPSTSVIRPSSASNSSSGPQRGPTLKDDPTAPLEQQLQDQDAEGSRPKGVTTTLEPQRAVGTGGRIVRPAIRIRPVAIGSAPAPSPQSSSSPGPNGEDARPEPAQTRPSRRPPPLPSQLKKN